MNRIFITFIIGISYIIGIGAISYALDLYQDGQIPSLGIMGEKQWEEKIISPLPGIIGESEEDLPLQDSGEKVTAQGGKDSDFDNNDVFPVNTGPSDSKLSIQSVSPSSLDIRTAPSAQETTDPTGETQSTLPSTPGITKIYPQSIGNINPPDNPQSSTPGGGYVSQVTHNENNGSSDVHLHLQSKGINPHNNPPRISPSREDHQSVRNTRLQNIPPQSQVSNRAQIKDIPGEDIPHQPTTSPIIKGNGSQFRVNTPNLGLLYVNSSNVPKGTFSTTISSAPQSGHHGVRVTEISIPPVPNLPSKKQRITTSLSSIPPGEMRELVGEEVVKIVYSEFGVRESLFSNGGSDRERGVDSSQYHIAGINLDKEYFNLLEVNNFVAELKIFTSLESGGSLEERFPKVSRDRWEFYTPRDIVKEILKKFHLGKSINNRVKLVLYNGHNFGNQIIILVIAILIFSVTLGYVLGRSYGVLRRNYFPCQFRELL